MSNTVYKNDLTVVISTIGRSTLYDSILKVLPEAQVLVVLDYNNRLCDIDHSLIPEEVKIVVNNIQPGPGGSKMYGLQYVDTTYFTFMDDDDYFLKGYLSFAIGNMNLHSADWMTSHNTNIDIIKYTENKIKIYDNKLKVISDYFNYNSYNEKNHHLTLCPSHLIYKTKTFRDYILKGGYPYKGYNNDDVLPMTDFVLNYKGINHLGYGYYYRSTPNSVGRAKINTYLISEKINILASLSTRGNECDAFWRQVLNNVLSIISYNNGKSRS